MFDLFGWHVQQCWTHGMCRGEALIYIIRQCWASFNRGRGQTRSTGLIQQCWTVLCRDGEIVSAILSNIATMLHDFVQHCWMTLQPFVRGIKPLKSCHLANTARFSWPVVARLTIKMRILIHSFRVMGSWFLIVQGGRIFLKYQDISSLVISFSVLMNCMFHPAICSKEKFKTGNY